ncbi:MAG TPA: ATP-binding cassette domain-containing protein [Vicinamibacterales bacterium]|nr:ATP-binding cassette domain-containing protein [Vicinamibacterales bacterium]
MLDSLTLTIGAGEHTAILGPNGAGKSTLMKLLALELYPLATGARGSSRAEPDDAPIRIFGRERWDVFDLRARLGIVSADLHDRFVHGSADGAGRSVRGLDAVLSGFFSSRGLFAHQEITPAMRDAARAALDRVGVPHLADTPLDRLSTGEARRVLIARALVHGPSALVLDEPTRGLDITARHRFLEDVRRLAHGGMTILLVTHHVEEIIPEIGRVILLSKGRIAADGPKDAVLRGAALAQVFGTRLQIDRADAYYHVRIESPGAQL